MYEKICNIAKEAGKIILSANADNCRVEQKEGRQNFVTEYDLRVQKFVFEQLKEVCPSADFLGEEDEGEHRFTSEYLFIVDPIDGTTNFMQGFNHSCVSIALLKNGKAYIGAVYNPYLDELFSAEAGKGAFLNGKPIHVSDRDLHDGMALFGTSPYRAENTDITFATVRKVFDLTRDIRRSGSAALDICYIAAGRCELYFEMGLCPWDFAAAALILTEAGGVFTGMSFEEVRYDGRFNSIAANPMAFEKYRESIGALK